MLLFGSITIVSGCKSITPCCDPNYVVRSLCCRTQQCVQPTSPCSETIPPSVVIEDGLDEFEAVTIGLTNNSNFQAAIAQLGMAGGDAVQASLLANPQVLLYFPSGAKEGQYTLYAPIESFLLRPTRVKIANREYQRIGEQLVQSGLNTARDTRLAYIDLALAKEQYQLAVEAESIREGIAQLTRRRFEDGDISELETIATKVDALTASANTKVQEQNVAIANAKLVSTIGVPSILPTVSPMPLTSQGLPELDEDLLIATALACRPDYNAAKWNVASTKERSRLSRWLFLRLDGVVDVREGPGYTRTGTGARFDLPIFNRNQGGVIRADWELNAAMHARDAIHDQIYQDVRIAFRQCLQAQQNLQIMETEVVPRLTEAVKIAEKGFADGGTDYMLVLQTTSQYLAARARVLDQRAAVRKAIAELERSIGRSLDDAPIEEKDVIWDNKAELKVARS